MSQQPKAKPAEVSRKLAFVITLLAGVLSLPLLSAFTSPASAQAEEPTDTRRCVVSVVDNEVLVTFTDFAVGVYVESLYLVDQDGNNVYSRDIGRLDPNSDNNVYYDIQSLGPISNLPAGEYTYQWGRSPTQALPERFPCEGSFTATPTNDPAYQLEGFRTYLRYQYEVFGVSEKDYLKMDKTVIKVIEMKERGNFNAARDQLNSIKNIANNAKSLTPRQVALIEQFVDNITEKLDLFEQEVQLIS